MTGERIEVLLEFGVILLSPVVHNDYLWKVKQVDASVIWQNIRIFGVLYALLAVGGVLLFLRRGW
jgi:hypothetical protein